jgi:hypothetical protein
MAQALNRKMRNNTSVQHHLIGSEATRPDKITSDSQACFAAAQAKPRERTKLIEDSFG